MGIDEILELFEKHCQSKCQVHCDYPMNCFLEFLAENFEINFKGGSKKYYVELVAMKWWKEWTWTPFSEEKYKEMQEDLQRYGVDGLEVIDAMTEIYNKYR